MKLEIKDPWIQELPLGWDAIPVKFVAKIDNSGVWGDEPEGCDEPIPVLRTSDIDANGNMNIEGAALRCLSSEEMERYVCQKGDIVVVKSSGSATNVITGKAALVQGDEGILSFSNFMLRISPDSKKIEPRFLYRFLTSGLIREQILLMVATTTYPNLNVGRYTGFRVPLPSLPVQRRIADYLDRETARIDALVAEKEKMLALLEEKRTALISRAVTRGLNPNAPLKPSGIDWLGDIPAHWSVERAKHLFSIRDERSEEGDEELLTVSHITGVTPRSEKEVYMFQAEDKAGYKKCYPGDLVVNTLWAWMGAMGVSPLEGIVSPDYHVYVSKGQLLSEFIELLCRSKPFVAEVNRWSKGVWSSRLRLYPENFFEMQLPIPPIDEQHEIVEHINMRAERSDELAKVLKESNQLLKERRAALITAAVTGQLDIEEMVA